MIYHSFGWHGNGDIDLMGSKSGESQNFSQDFSDFVCGFGIYAWES